MHSMCTHLPRVIRLAIELWLGPFTVHVLMSHSAAWSESGSSRSLEQRAGRQGLGFMVQHVHKRGQEDHAQVSRSAGQSQQGARV